ncbi:MAG TPA: ATP-dependent RNA helicase HrpA, partial [Sedimenticola sp.]|nr:ATP-dependent RNA helicase HrpA [Sedimenticola sp.]
SGEREIRETAESLRKHRLPLTEVLPLYARLGPTEQARIFRPGGGRRIILATNVAETSLTVPGIRYVIDTGFARISRYSHRSKVQRLPVEPVSRASAEQRKGRCGRVAAGICIRLYSEESFAARPEFTEPEILRTNLASVILQMKILGFGEIEAFPFVDPPDRRLIRDGYRILTEIGALGGDRRVTPLGRQLARLPVDPRIARMLLAAAAGHCLAEVLVIAAALSVQDPRERPLEKQQAADEAHLRFRHEASDFLGFLNLWRHLEEQRRHLSRRKFRQHCQSSFLSWTRVQEWHDIHRQLRLEMHGMGFRENEAEAGYEEIHRALLAGLLSHVGFKGGGKGHEYQGARNSRFMIFPGSALFRKQPKWVMAAELVETTRLYARSVAMIQPAWVEAVAGDQVRRSHAEPHWEKGRGQVAAYEKVTLFGLPLVPRRKVNFGPVDPVLAREIFIRSALVDGDFQTRAPFWRHNRELIEEVEMLEHRSRRRDLLVDREQIYAYYDKRIPEGVYSTPAFERWLRRATTQKPKLLHMRLQDLMHREIDADTREQFPEQLDLNGVQLPLAYRFDPGRPEDGVTLKIPLAVLNQVPEERCEWLVPGLLRERVIALLRSLPKALRRNFVPVPEYADACLQRLTPSERPLTQALAGVLKELTGVHVPEDAWDEGALPEHLRMNFQLLDDRGRCIARGRDLQALKRAHGEQAGEGHQALDVSGLEREGLDDWNFGALEENVTLERGGIRLLGFPALVDRGERVDLRILDSAAAARRATRAGLRRLFMLQLPREMRDLRRNLPGLQRLRLQYARAADPPAGLSVPAGQDLEQELLALIVDHCFLEGLPAVRNEAAFRERLAARRGELPERAREVLELAGRILGAYQGLRKG